MTADDLTLPQPARAFWLETRDVVRAALQQLEPGIDYRIGGGTILAARWKHRSSFDVDIQVDKRTPLKELKSGNFGWLDERIASVGAKANYNPSLNLYTIRRGDTPATRQEVQLWGHDPEIAAGHTRVRVEGRAETVLSTSQILRGKLERARQHPARDVYDVCKATALDPVSLEIAVNTIPHDRISKAALIWTVAYGRIGNEAYDRLRGVAPEDEAKYYQIAKTGAKALLQARYAQLRLGVEDGRIVMEAVTHGGQQRRMTMTASTAATEFEAKGINGHLRDKGPGANALREYAIELCRRGSGDVLVFKETNDTETHWRLAKSARSLKLIAPDRPVPGAAHAGGWVRSRTDWQR